MTARTGVALAVALLVLAPALGAVTVAAVQTDVAIQSVDVSTDEPAPGESFTLTVTLANLQSSDGPVDVTSLYVRRSGTTTEYARIEDVGTVSPGSTVDIPLTVQVDTVGGTRLTVHAVVQDSDDNFTRVTYPLYVDVQDPDEALLSVSDLDLVAGQERVVNVTVANGDDAALTNLDLELAGARVENPQRVAASLAAGAERTFQFRVTVADPGDHELRANLTYKTSDGYTRSVSRAIPLTVAPAVVDPELTATVQVQDGAPVVRATLTEYGNAELRDVQVRVLAGGTTVARSLVPDVPAEGTQTVTLDGDGLPAGELTVVATYTAAGEARRTETTIDYSPAPSAQILLTGVEFARDDAVLTIRGDAANVGSADASSVVVSVVSADGVRPVAPKKEYFVGAIDASEFATFEVTAAVDDAVETVPVRVEYTVDGERHDTVVQVDVADAPSSDADAGQQPTPAWLYLLGAIALLALVGGGYYWRTR